MLVLGFPTFATVLAWQRLGLIDLRAYYPGSRVSSLRDLVILHHDQVAVSELRTHNVKGLVVRLRPPAIVGNANRLLSSRKRTIGDFCSPYVGVIDELPVRVICSLSL